MPLDNFKKKLRIGDILVNNGYITQEELQQALARQKESGQNYAPLGQICVELGFISSVDLSKILRKHCKHIYLGELLVNLGIINSAQLEQVLEKQKNGEKKRLGQLLLESGFLTEEQLARSLSMQLGFPFIVPTTQLIDQKLLMRFHESFLRRQEAIPVFEKEGVVTLIMADPLADDIISDFKKSLNAEIEPAIATRSAIHSLLDTLSHNKIEYGQKGEKALAGKNLVIGSESCIMEVKDDTVNIVNYIISSAITEGASDIHIEPQPYNLRVRFRIDGVLQHKTDLPKRMAPSIISRIKVMCGMDIAEHRKHQDGRIEARIMDNDIDLRVSAYSAVYGENIVIRILRRQTTLIDLDKLGFSPINLKRYRKVLNAPTGIILVCGPTGSGKTTTLYASLNYLNGLEKKIITVEDPVEYTIEGVVQGQLNPKIGLSYLDYIASMMRQDPDVIMVGEIRDNAAAAATIQAALTGHKVLSTFHTEDSTGALLRLMDMGIETFLISSTVVSVVAQRLVRKVCSNCKESYQPDPILFQNLGIKNVDPKRYSFVRGRGCSLCNHTGYRGRTGIHELLVLNEDIRDAILSRKTSSEIRQIARSLAQMVTMREDSFFKIAQGITTPEEVLRVLFYSDTEIAFPKDAEELIRQIEAESIEALSLAEEGRKALAGEDQEQVLARGGQNQALAGGGRQALAGEGRKQASSLAAAEASSSGSLSMPPAQQMNEPRSEAPQNPTWPMPQARLEEASTQALAEEAAPIAQSKEVIHALSGEAAGFSPAQETIHPPGATLGEEVALSTLSSRFSALSDVTPISPPRPDDRGEDNNFIPTQPASLIKEEEKKSEEKSRGVSPKELETSSTLPPDQGQDGAVEEEEYLASKIKELEKSRGASPKELETSITLPSDQAKEDARCRISGEVYRIRFEADAIDLEQDRIRELFQKYQSLRQEFGHDLSDNLLADFIDFIVYHTSLARKRYGAAYVEFFLKIIDGQGPKIFIQFQSTEPARSAFSPHLERARGRRLMEFLA